MWGKKEIDSERIKENIKQVIRHQKKADQGLKNLEKWFAQGKIKYHLYEERRRKLNKLKGEYQLYLYRTRKELEKLKGPKKTKRLAVPQKIYRY